VGVVPEKVRLLPGNQNIDNEGPEFRIGAGQLAGDDRLDCRPDLVRYGQADHGSPGSSLGVGDHVDGLMRCAQRPRAISGRPDHLFDGAPSAAEGCPRVVGGVLADYRIATGLRSELPRFLAVFRFAL
jgi:hypothetical protein